DCTGNQKAEKSCHSTHQDDGHCHCLFMSFVVVNYFICSFKACLLGTYKKVMVEISGLSGSFSTIWNMRKKSSEI
ncbi:MAG: hypothetical protein ACK53Y_11700, partial [bacterium]